MKVVCYTVLNISLIYYQNLNSIAILHIFAPFGHMNKAEVHFSASSLSFILS